jgi:hypothetical protein
MATSLSPRSAPVHPTRQQLDELDALLQRMLDLPVNQVDEEDEPDEVVAVAEPPVSYRVPIAEPAPGLAPRVVPAEESVLPPPRPVVPPTAVPVEMPPPAPPAPAPILREPGPDDWVRLASTWQPSAQTWQPLAQSWQQAARPAERPVPTSPLPAPVAPASISPLPEIPERAPVFQAPEVVAPSSPPEMDLADLVVPPTPAPQVQVPATHEPARALGYAWWQWPFVPANAAFDLVTLALGPLGAGMRSRAGRNLLAAIGVGCVAAAAVLILADEFGWIW